MIKLLRVDHRLLHGQVAFTWTTSLGADAILIANDGVANDEVRKMTMKLAKPSGIKLVIKSVSDAIQVINSGVTDKYKVFIVVESIADAFNIVENCSIVRKINLGGTKVREETRNISKAVNVTKEEENKIKKMMELGSTVEIRMIPIDKPINAKSVIL